MGAKKSVKIVAFVGAGGKTSSIYLYAKKLIQQNKRVIITTTTHMQFPNDVPLCSTATEVKNELLKNNYAVCGLDDGIKNGTHKIISLPENEFELCKTFCDYILVESDGAKCLPIKVPSKHEPVIPSFSDIIVVCAGLDSLQKKISEVCFRKTEALSILNKYLKTEHTQSFELTEKAISYLIFYGYIQPLCKNQSSKKICVLLNKSDFLTNLDSANLIAKKIEKLCSENKINDYGCSFDGIYIGSIKKMDIIKYSGENLKMNKNSYRFAALHLNEEDIISRNVNYSTGTFSERLSKNPQLIICGAGHVSFALCEVASKIGFSVTVIDERPELVVKDRFKSASKIICGPYIQTLQALENKCAWFAIMTPGHAKDLECVQTILSFNAIYVGMIGSHKKVQHTNEVLKELGFSEDKINSIHAPIGLSINAQTPEEIAISICAQLIQERAALKCSYLDENVYNSLLNNKEKMIIATIIEKTGSAPRGVGSCLAVFADGSFVGTIGGGSVENAVIQDAKNTKIEATPFVKEYNLSNSAASTLGMICGGTIKVLFECSD